jgi:hypothetical protein
MFHCASAVYATFYIPARAYTNCNFKKSSKKPNRYSHSVYRRRTDKTIVKRKSTKDKQRPTKQSHNTKENEWCVWGGVFYA